MIEPILIDTDFATITVAPKKARDTRDGLEEHALHMLMADYRARYGADAAHYVLTKLHGYYGQK